MQAFSRTALLLGENAMKKLKNAKVAVFGLGGVGSYVAEALARSGIGALELIDHDTVSLTNINRQLIATHSTIGKYKADVAAARALDINPEMQACSRKVFFGPDTVSEFDFSQYSYVVDAVDTVTAKLALITAAQGANVPIISSMGTGNKLDPTLLSITDISKTFGCPLARVMRKELRARNIHHLKVVFSPEEAHETTQPETPPPGRRSVPASVAWVPSCAGLMLGGAVVQDLISRKE